MGFISTIGIGINATSFDVVIILDLEFLGFISSKDTCEIPLFSLILAQRDLDLELQ